MTMLVANANAKSASVYATITRANGAVENLGIISYYHRNSAVCWVVNAYIKLKGFLKS